MEQAWRWVAENLITSGTFWSAVGAIATMFAVAGIFQAAKQLRFDAWLKAQEIFTSFTDSRTKVYAHLAKPTEVWSPPDKEEGLLVCRKLDELCHLAPYLGRGKILDAWGNPLATSWVLLKWLVQQERDKSSWPTKWAAFERLGEKALEAVHMPQRQKLITARDQSVTALRNVRQEALVPTVAAQQRDEAAKAHD